MELTITILSELCGLGLSTVATITKEVSEAIVEELWDDCISTYMPSSEEAFRHKILDMEEMWQFPCCWAAIDGCHLPLKCPCQCSSTNVCTFALACMVLHNICLHLGDTMPRKLDLTIDLSTNEKEIEQRLENSWKCEIVRKYETRPCKQKKSEMHWPEKLLVKERNWAYLLMD